MKFSKGCRPARFACRKAQACVGSTVSVGCCLYRAMSRGALRCIRLSGEAKSAAKAMPTKRGQYLRVPAGVAIALHLRAGPRWLWIMKIGKAGFISARHLHVTEWRISPRTGRPNAHKASRAVQTLASAWDPCWCDPDAARSLPTFSLRIFGPVTPTSQVDNRRRPEGWFSSRDKSYRRTPGC